MAGAVVGFTSELIRLNNNHNNEKQSKRKYRFILSTKSASIVLPVEDDFIIGVTFSRFYFNLMFFEVYLFLERRVINGLIIRIEELY